MESKNQKENETFGKCIIADNVNNENGFVFVNHEKDFMMRKQITLPATTKDYLRIVNPHFETQYANSLQRLLEDGIRQKNRTGIDTLVVDHQYFEIKDVLHNFPKIKGKKVYPKMALKELLWMMQGRTDVKWLNDHGVTYWDEWQDKEGTIGKSYGYQFRNFNGVDQLMELINTMIKDPCGRRHILNLWNPYDLPQMMLPPCMYDYHFNVAEYCGKYFTSLHAHVRSNDAFLGAPYDFMFCGWFLMIICEYLSIVTGKRYVPKDIHYTADNYHLYVNHIEQAKQYIQNTIENKYNVCLSNCFVILSKLKIEESIKHILSIDEYIYFLIEKIKYIQITKPVYNGKEIDFEYPVIKGEIAV